MNSLFLIANFFNIPGVPIACLALVIVAALLIMSRGMDKDEAEAPEAPAAAPAAPAAPAVAAGKVPAKGSLGDIDLHDVPPATAAMIMAIVADKLDAPLNELRFISIKEIK